MQLPAFITLRQSANSKMWFSTPHNSEDEAMQRHQQDRRNGMFMAAALFQVHLDPDAPMPKNTIKYERLAIWEREKGK